jgi:hypothetical protein
MGEIDQSNLPDCRKKSKVRTDVNLAATMANIPLADADKTEYSKNDKEFINLYNMPIIFNMTSTNQVSS